MQYNNDGTKLFTVHQRSTVGHTAKIVEWSLSTAYDPMTASTNADFNDTSTYFETGEAVSSAGNGIPTQFITFNNDGTKFFSFNHTHETGSSSSQKIKEWNLASPFNLVNVSGEHSGDVINTSSTDNYDTDPDGDTLTVTTYSHTSATDEDGGSISSTSSTGTAGTNNVTGYYGTLDLEGDGSYTYTADLTATQALDPGDTVTDVFTYTVDDGNGETDTATITITVNGMNDAPTAVADTDSVDAGSTVTDEDGAGTLVSDDTDPDASSSLYVTKITGNGNTSNVTYNSTKISNAATIVGSKGTLTFGSDGSYSYAADSDATSGDDVFTYTLTDGTSTSTATLTISVTEVANNAPTITAQTDVAGAVTEITDGASGEGTNNLTDTGSFTIADLDNDSVSVSTAEGTTDAVGGSFLGALTATVADDTDDGSGQINWTYTVADADVEYLEEGETVTETFTVTVSDGNGGTVDQTVTVVITGANDAPTLTTGAVDVAVNEASDASAQDLSSSGTITFADLDETTSITAATSTVTGSSGVSIPSAVNTALLSAITVTDNSDNTAGWTLSATDLDLDFLTAGQTITLEKVVTATDGQSATVTDTITVTITGTNDTPTLTTGAVDVAVNEASDASAQDLSSSGTITFADLDETTSITAATSTVTGSSGVSIPSAVNTALLSAITVTDNSDNTAGWTLSATDLDLDFLTAGQTITLEKVVTATDGQSATVTDTITVTITGTNDAPTLTTGAVDVAVNEASDASAQDLSSSGTITFADLDETTSITAATSTVTGSSGVSIPSAVNTALLSAITVTDNSDNTAGWTLSATDLDLDFLTAGQTITLEKVVTATDGQSATVTDTITVTITGTNDAPTLTTGAVDVAVNEASDASAQDLSSSGTITFADLDETTSITAATSTVTGSSGVSIPSAVNTALLSAITVTDNSDNTAGWTLSATDLDLDFLTAGQTITLEKVVTATDGQSATVTDTITVTITGTNDTPTLTTGAVDVAVNEASDASAQDLSSSGTITFADLDETTSITAATSTVTGSSGVSIPSAVNTALLSAITVTDNSDNTAGWTLSATDLDLDFLTAGQTITLEKVVTATDGQSATVTDTITVTITGTNDTPTLTTGAVDVAVNEASDASAQDLSSSGTITFADLDETTSITAATSTVTGSSGVSIPSAVNTALLSAITVTDNSDNTAGWTLSATDLDLDFLTAGQTITLEKVVTATDGQSATVTDTITVTITGTNDTPTLTTGAVDVAVNEASDASAQDLSSSGTITFADLDETTSITAATSTVTGSSGVSIPSAVNTALLSAITVTDNSDNTAGWTLSATDLDLDFLTAGQTITLEKVVTATDGQSATVTDTITVTITGTNDAPTLTTGAVDVAVNEASDASAQDLSSSGTITFADLDETTSITAATSTVTGSSGVSIPSAVNTALLSAITVTDNSDNTAGWTLSATDLDLDFLTAGQTITLEKVVTATDGQSATVTDTITVTITGTNDAPTLTTGAVDVAVNEASDASAQDLSSSGTITFADLDETTSITAATSTVTGSSGVSIPSAVNTALLSAITVTDNSDNTAGWTLSATDLDLDFLTAGQTITLEKVVTATDGQSATVTDTITVTITGTNDAPTLTTGAVDVAVNEASDASAQDLSSSGTITFADLDETTSITAATSTVTGSSGVSIPSAVNTALLSAITVTDNSDNTAGWTLSATDLDLDFLTAGQTITLEKVVTATDGQSATVTDTITVTITGTNDAPTITAQTDVAGAVTEITDGASGEGTNNLTDTGSFTIADLDNDSVSVSTAEGTTDAVGGSFLGALTATVADDTDDGSGQINWTYTVADADVEYLEAGETVTETFTVTVSDGNGGTVDQTVTVVITGANDAPTLTTGAVDVAVNEASDASAQDLSSSGTITFADLDETTSITAATSTVTGSSGVSIPSAVNTALLSAITVTDNSDNTAGWTLSATDLDLDFLTAGQTITLEKVVTATDGQSATVTDTITVTITGTNDTPTLTTGAVDVAVNEASDASAQDLSSSGTITFADLDETTSITAATSTVTGSSGVSIPSAVNTALLSAITVTDNSDNTAGWTLSATDLDLDFLTAGQTITLEKVVTATDGQSATVTDTITVTITGTNDAPTLTTGAVDVAVNEASDASAQDLSSSGTITFADLDETTSITAATSTVTGSSGVSIPSAVNTALLSAITVTDNSDNTAGWTLSATDLDLDFLTAGQTITLEKVVTATDGQSATVTDTITVTITGTNDTPTLTTGAVDVAVNEASDASAQDLSSSGTITFADLDETTSITAATSTVTGSSGVSIPSAVNTALLSAITVTDNSDNTAGWTLSATDLDLDFLTAGQTITLEKVVTATDGQSATVTDTITVTITGTNDTPTLTTGAVDVAVNEASDASAQDLSSSGTITFADLDETTSITAATSTVTGSSGVSIPSAVNTALLSAITVTDNSDNTAGWTLSATDLDLDFLTAGQTITLEKVVTATDGQSATVTDTITVTITGTNDAPTITAQTDVAGAVTEITDGASGEGTNNLTDTGSFTIADLDNDSVSVSTAEGTTDAVGGSFLGALTATVADDTDDGSGQINWTYTVADADVEYLEAGETVTETFTVTVSDGNGGTVDQTVTVVITGANDAPTLTTGAVDVAVNEASDASAQDLSSSGTITFADLDETTSITAATSTVTGSSGVSIPSAVNTALLSAITVTDNSDNTAGWTLSATDLDLDFLTAGQTITLEKVVTATDGQSATVTDTITVTITGTNDTPTLTTGAVDVAVNEASDASAQDLSSSGTITFADLDETTSITAATSTVTGSSGVSIPSAVNTALLSAITVTDNSDNTAGWTLSATDLDLDFLTAGQTITLEKVVTATDGQSATVTDTITVTITGTNDAPTLTTGAVDVAVNEASDASAQDLSSSGTITFADLDETTSITAATSTVTGSSGVSIPSAVNTALLSAITVTDNSDNTAGWTLSATDLDLDFLTAGQTITLEKVVTATDGQSATVTDTITVTITGTNDTPTLTTGAVDVAVNEASDASAQDLSSSGTITFADLDETTSITAATSTVTGSSGVSIPSAVNTALLSAITVTDNSDNTAGWTLSATDLDLDFLTAGQTITLEKVVTATDGQSATVTDTITVTITGTNDTPTLTTGAVDVAVNEASDASAQDLSSSGTITFADLDETTSITAATSTVTGSSGVSIPSAVNTALLSAITVTDNSDNTAGWTLSATDLDLDFLTAGQTITLEKVVTATDGQSATVTDTITVTITGTNDTPTLTTGAVDVAVNEASDASAQDLSSSGTITFADLDETTSITAATSTVTGSSGVSIPSAVNTALLSAITVTDNSDNTAGWTLSATDLDLDFLTAGQTITLEKVVTATDGQSATVTDTITVTITGTNDAPVANVDTISVAAGTPATGNVVTANDTDPDGDSLTVSAIAEGDVGLTHYRNLWNLYSKL